MTYLRRLVIGTLPVIASIILVNLFFYPGSTDVIFAIGPFEATQEGLDFGLPIAARLVAAVAATLWSLQSTRPDDLMETLIQRGAGPKLAFVVLSTIQTVPRMGAKAPPHPRGASRHAACAPAARRALGCARSCPSSARSSSARSTTCGSVPWPSRRAPSGRAGRGLRTASSASTPPTGSLTTAAWLALAALPIYVVARFAGVVA